MKKIIPQILLCLLINFVANATHFRYGHISWTRQPGTRIVTFTVTCAWNPNSSAPETTNLNFGDGILNGDNSGTVIGSGPDYVIRQYTATHTYSNDGPFTAYFERGDRIDGLQGGASEARFKVSSTICLTGNNNGSPVNLSPQILKLPRLNNAQLQLNALDSDGTTVTFSQTTIAGAGYSYVAPNYGGNTLTVSSTGQVNWNTLTIPIGYLYVLRVKFSDGCAESEADYIVEIVGGTCTACTDKVLADFTDNDRFCATQYLCNNLIVKANQPDPKGKIIRGDLANITYRGLIGESYNTTAKDFPCPFIDLQINDASTSEYYKHAKTLSYLDYQDGRSPFDRNKVNFYPNDTITRAVVLKVLLEAWNIDKNTASGSSPFSDVTTGHPYYKYIKKAHELGIVTGSGGLFKPDLGCSREDAFLMLYRIMSSTTIIKPTLAQINAGFFVPNTFRPDNLGVGIGNDRGNFNHYTKTSFAMDGTVPLVFAHSYNSYATELPSQLFNDVMGRGWTHSFNCYIKTIPNIEKIVVHYPDGTLHYYSMIQSGGTSIFNYKNESIGVYDKCKLISIYPFQTFRIVTPSNITYDFEKLAGGPDGVFLIKSISDRNGNTLSFTNELGFNNYPRLKSVSDPAGRTLNFVYKPSFNWLIEVNLTGVGAFNGRKVTFDYHTLPIDGDGFPDLKEYKEPDLTGTLKTTTYGYFAFTDSTTHLLKTITLPKGNVIDNTYQQRKLISSRTMNGASVVQKMDVNLTPSYTSTSSSTSSVVKTTDENGLQKTTNYQHNTNGLPTQVTTTGTQPLDLGMAYSNANDPTAVTNLTQNGTGVRIKYFNTVPYNVEYIKTAKAVGDSISQSFTYNTFNDVLTSTNGRGFTTTFEYSATGNLTKITDPLNKNTIIARRTDGLVQSVTTPTGIQTTFGYNTYGNLNSTSVANGASSAITTSSVYDELSRLTSTTDPRNKQTSYQYFSNDLLKKTTAPLSVTTDYNYDNNDNLLSITNAKGNATTMSYDTQTDQLMSRSFAGKSETFTYYQDGSLKTYTNKRGNAFNFTYDASGRLKNDSYATYDYNPDGTLNTISNSSNSRNYVLDYDYDVLKRISKTRIDNKDILYAYDNNNNLSTLTYPDGKIVTYTYDSNDRLTNISDWLNRNTTYTYDDDGKLLNYTLPNGMKCIYSYDAAGRMTGMRNEKTGAVVLNSYAYVLDAAGNHLEENVVEPYSAAITLTAGTTNYTTDNGNQQTTAGNNTYAFDGNGAITNQAGQALTFDTKDNLLTGYNTSFYYDGNETRRAKTGKRFIINELTNSVLAETDDAGNYLYYYVYGPTGLLYRQSVGGTVEFYHYDFRGSTIATTNNSQTIVRQYQYDAFGKILQTNTSTDDNPFRYVGQHGVQYEAPNLYFMRARYYDPSTGRFVSEDPIWATNLYPYADNNPVMMIDAMGQTPKIVDNCDLVFSIVSIVQSAGSTLISISKKTTANGIGKEILKFSGNQGKELILIPMTADMLKQYNLKENPDKEYYILDNKELELASDGIGGNICSFVYRANDLIKSYKQYYQEIEKSRKIKIPWWQKVLGTRVAFSD
jgi:RHS repeat-associated protein